jgi:hypothetical protein
MIEQLGSRYVAAGSSPGRRRTGAATSGTIRLATGRVNRRDPFAVLREKSLYNSRSIRPGVPRGGIDERHALGRGELAPGRVTNDRCASGGSARHIRANYVETPLHACCPTR